MCGVTSCLVLQLQSAEVSRTVTSSFVWSWRSVLILMKGPKIPRTELSTVHLYQHYSLFMHNKLQYTWRGDYCECVRPAQLPVLTRSSGSVPPGTISTIRYPPGTGLSQANSSYNFKQSPFLGLHQWETRKSWGQKLWPDLHLSFSYIGNGQHLDK